MGKKMKKMSLLVVVAAVLVFAGCKTPEGATPAAKREYAQDMRREALNDLYQEKPETRAKIANAAGYGVFSNFNINLLLLSSGNGFGVVRDNATGKDTYMKMRMLGLGLGAGVKDFRAVIIFKNQQALRTFTEEGWEWGGHADATAVADESGGEIGTAGEITGDMEIYNFTETGIALQATIAGTKYWKDKAMN